MPSAETTANPLKPELETIACCLCRATAGYRPVLTATNFNLECGPAAAFQIVQCQRCGLQFTNPRPTPAFLAAFYPQQYYAYQPKPPKPQHSGLKALGARIEGWSKLAVRQAFWNYPAGMLYQWLVRLLCWPLALRMCLLGKDLKIIPYRGQGRFLDVGCGTGGDLVYQRQFGLQVAGVEWNASAAERARLDHGLDVRAGTLESARFPDQSFDMIHMSHVFEHLPNPARTLDELHRLLDANGLLILKVPDAGSASAARFGPHWLGYDVPRHLYHFTRQTMAKLLQEHGFVLEAIRQDPGMWSMWRESERFERRARGQSIPADSWWNDTRQQAAEWWACLAGRGSAMAVYARKIAVPGRTVTAAH